MTIRRRSQGLVAALRTYVGEVSSQDLQRMFRRDAAEAFAVLTRDRADAQPPRGVLRTFFHSVKLIFLGMSAKLSPARRVLFVAALGAAVLGMVRIRADIASQSVAVETSPFWFMVSILALVFLLALELVDRIRVRDELEVARALQLELLPRSAPAIPGFEIAHSYRTANEVGGDYYDFLPLSDGRYAVVIGDASGHGMASGLLMAIANATLKIALDFDPAPEKVVALLNRVMCRTGNRRSFMTMFYGVLSPADGRLEYVCAGHPFPLLRRADSSTVELGRGSLPLGIRSDLVIAAEAVEIAPGDVLVLYTDGLPEAPGRSGEAFGYDRLRTLVAAGGPPQVVHDRVLATFRAFIGDEPLRDDACLVVLRRA